MVLTVGTGLSYTRRTVDCSKASPHLRVLLRLRGSFLRGKKRVFSRPVDELKDRLR